MGVLESAVNAERELSEALEAYVGRWVAVKDHKVVADAATLYDLLERVGDDEVDGVFQVVEESGAASFF
jgi:hypothetical protein